MGKCYKKIHFNYLVVNKRNAQKALEILGHWNRPEFKGFITRAELEEFHKAHRFVGFYQYGYYDEKQHKLMYGTIDHRKYDTDEYGMMESFEVKGKDYNIKCGYILIYFTNIEGKYKLVDIIDEAEFKAEYIKE